MSIFPDIKVSNNTVFAWLDFEYLCGDRFYLMIRNIIFDFGAVLVDWNPHYLYDPYFGDVEKATWFLENICTFAWNRELDGGKPFDEGVAELSAIHPEWSREIELYKSGWIKMMGGQIPGMYEIVAELKSRGYGVWGLTNWSSETLCQIEDKYPVFSLLDGRIVSGEVRLLKPDEAIYRCLLNTFGLKAEECLFIDDNAENVDGALKLGIEAWTFTDAATLRTRLAAAHIL